MHWPRIQPGALDTYARRTLINTCLRTRGSRQREVVVDDVPATAVAGPPLAASLDQRLDLMQAMAALAPRERAVVALRFLDDLPVSEAAAILGLPEGTVKSRTSRALARLQTHLAPRHPSLQEHSHHDH